MNMAVHRPTIGVLTAGKKSNRRILSHIMLPRPSQRLLVTASIEVTVGGSTGRGASGGLAPNFGNEGREQDIRLIKVHEEVSNHPLWFCEECNPLARSARGCEFGAGEFIVTFSGSIS